MTADGGLITGRERLMTADGRGGLFCVRFGFFFFFMKAILSFFDFWTIFCCLLFFFSFFFDLPQVSNCCESDSFMFLILDHFWLFFFFFLFIFALTFHKCLMVMKAILSFFDFWTIFCCF